VRLAACFSPAAATPIVALYTSAMKALVWLLVLYASVQATGLYSQSTAAPIPQPIALWPNGAPGALGTSEADQPRLYPFIPPKPSTDAAILVIPGGGYQVVAMGYEGIQLARWLNAQGMTAFVLDYRVAPYKYPVEINDGMRAMRYIRAHAAGYHIDPGKIGVLGFSAGGHLASTLATHCKTGNPADPDTIERLDCRPDFMVLGYPVIGMEPPVNHSGSRNNLLGASPDPALVHTLSNQFAVSAQTPPTFLFATTNDPVVPIQNSLDFYRALERAHVPAEMHLFDYADHGCGLCASIPAVSEWPMLLRNWLIHRNVLPPGAPPMPPPEPNMPIWPKGMVGPGQPH
jgi:acetyl esterase/lipase